MSANLLATKLHRPAPPSRLVQRPRLVQLLNEGIQSSCPLTLISAPAGFGKSTCVSEWVDGLAMPVAWLSLDAADNDPLRFFTYTLAALKKADDRIGREIEGILEAGQIPLIPTLITTLLNDILNIEQKILLVLDDFHVIRESSILNGMEMWIANQPKNMHLVLITREDPQLPLARMRAHHQMIELRAANLRFTRAEVDQLLNEQAGLGLSKADIDTLEERTEGWVVGLQLAGFVLQSEIAKQFEIAPQSKAAFQPTHDRVTASEFIANLSGSQRYILSYLMEEVLNRQPEDIRAFLLETSILDRLNGDLCDAVTGRKDSRSLLEQLYNANLFLVPLDDSSSTGAAGTGAYWYRYHHLFADLLRDRQYAFQKDKTAEFHRRASAWYRQAGMINEAVQHALAGEDITQAVSLIESQMMTMILQGYVMTVEGWLNAIPAEYRWQSPKINLAFAWMHLLRGTYAEVSRYVQHLQTIFSSTAQDQVDASLQAEWLALRSYLLTTQGKAVESLDLANQSLKLAPERDGYVRSLAYNALGCAYLLADEYDQSVAAYQAAIQEGRAAGNAISEMMGVSVLAQMAVQHGQLHFAFQVASQGISLSKRRDGQPTGNAAGTLPSILAIEHAALGQVYYQWNQLEQARGHFLRAIQLCSLGGYSDLEIFHRVCFSRLLQLEGNLDFAAEEIQKAFNRLPSGVHVWMRDETIAQQVRVSLALDQLAEAERAFNLVRPDNEGVGSHFSEPFVLPVFAPEPAQNQLSAGLYNSALRILLKRAQQKGEQVNLPGGIELAGRLIDRALRGKVLPIAVESLLLRAQLYLTQGNQQAGFADVARALELAEPEGFISIFVEAGPPIAESLLALQKHNLLGAVQPEYVHNILAAFSSAPRVNSQAGSEPALQSELPLAVPVSPRELEVLRLVSEGYSNQAIAGKLVLSLHTVKKHISNLFTKLGVSSRTQAADQARKRHLL